MLEDLLNKYNRQRLRDYLSGFVYALNLERRAGHEPTREERRVVAFYMALCVHPNAPVDQLVRMADRFIEVY